MYVEYKHLKLKKGGNHQNTIGNIMYRSLEKEEEAKVRDNDDLDFDCNLL